jgi:hypothetical protein
VGQAEPRLDVPGLLAEHASPLVHRLVVGPCLQGAASAEAATRFASRRGPPSRNTHPPRAPPGFGEVMRETHAHVTRPSGRHHRPPGRIKDRAIDHGTPTLGRDRSRWN